MGWMPKDGKPIKLNGTFHTNLSIMKFVVALAAEAELGGNTLPQLPDGYDFSTNIS
jgi:hypothetical protein